MYNCLNINKQGGNEKSNFGFYAENYYCSISPTKGFSCMQLVQSKSVYCWHHCIH